MCVSTRIRVDKMMNGYGIGVWGKTSQDDCGSVIVDLYSPRSEKDIGKEYKKGTVCE